VSPSRGFRQGDDLLASLPLVAAWFDWTAGVCKILIVHVTSRTSDCGTDSHSAADCLSEVDEAGHGGCGSTTAIEPVEAPPGGCTLATLCSSRRTKKTPQKVHIFPARTRGRGGSPG